MRAQFDWIYDSVQDYFVLNQFDFNMDNVLRRTMLQVVETSCFNMLQLYKYEYLHSELKPVHEH